MNKLQKFIEDNDIELDGSGSDLNGNCVILAGYSLFLGYDRWDQVFDEIDPDEELECFVNAEFERVFDYAKENNYEKWWHSEKNRSIYIL